MLNITVSQTRVYLQFTCRHVLLVVMASSGEPGVKTSSKHSLLLTGPGLLLCGPAVLADRNRWRVGLQPFPRAVPPPPPPSEDRTKEILADPRVQAVRQRENANANQVRGTGCINTKLHMVWHTACHMNPHVRGH